MAPCDQVRQKPTSVFHSEGTWAEPRVEWCCSREGLKASELGPWRSSLGRARLPVCLLSPRLGGQLFRSSEALVSLLLGRCTWWSIQTGKGCPGAAMQPLSRDTLLQHLTFSPPTRLEAIGPRCVGHGGVGEPWCLCGPRTPHTGTMSLSVCARVVSVCLCKGQDELAEA